jgi:hypothetical protein
MGMFLLKASVGRVELVRALLIAIDRSIVALY